jgi:hypothetical protein
VTLFTLGVQLFYGGAWHGLDPAAVLEAAPVATQRGYAEEGSIRPAEIRLRILDDAQDYDPDNVLSPLYGLIGRRTPILVSIDGQAEAAGEVASWRAGASPDWLPDTGTGVRGYRYVDVIAAGYLRRVSNWTREIRSPMTRQLSRSRQWRAYWPCEDLKSAGNTLANLRPGGEPAATDVVTLQGDQGPAGSAPVVTTGVAGLIRGNVIVTGTSTAWQFGLAFDLSDVSLPAAPGLAGLIVCRSSNGWRWTIGVGQANVALTAYNSDGDQVGQIFRTWSESVGGHDQWVWARVLLTFTTGNVNANLGLTYEGATTRWQYAMDVPASNMGQPVTVQAGQDNAHIGHIIVTGATDDLLGADLRQSLNGYVGETAADRVARLCAQEGVPLTVQGVAAQTQAMGPQTPDALLSLLRECADTEDALIFEPRDQIALTMRTRRHLYAPPKLALSYPDHIAQPFAATSDDLSIANIVTVKQADGGQASASAPPGSAMDPDEVGEERKEHGVNVADEAVYLQGLADYWLNRLGVLGARYPSVVIDALVNPVQAKTAAALQPGDLITISGYRSTTIYLMVLAVSTVTSAATRRVSLTTVPGDVFRVGVYNQATSRYDVNSTLYAPVDATATSITVDSPRVVAWSLTAVPYVWIMDGETVRVTTITAPSGNTNRQTATVDRSVNGVQRSHTAGTPVSLADPVRYGR